jgi:exonuclease SbcD
MDPNRRNIIMSHSFIVNAELSDSDRAARVGFATAVSKDVFQGFDYVALGHIHKPQIIAPGIRYCGSPLKYSFGAEEKQEKGVVLLDTDAMEERFVALPMLRDRKSFTGTFEELMALEGIEEDYLWMHVTDRYAGLELQAQMRQKYPYLLELYGKSLLEEGELSALTVEQLQTMNETDIMIKFLEESFSYTPNEDQLAIFRDALEKSAEEGDLG